jgi:hypothetical protein
MLVSFEQIQNFKVLHFLKAKVKKVNIAVTCNPLAWTRVDVVESDKHSTLILHGIKYRRISVIVQPLS